MAACDLSQLAIRCSLVMTCCKQPRRGEDLRGGGRCIPIGVQALGSDFPSLHYRCAKPSYHSLPASWNSFSAVNSETVIDCFAYHLRLCGNLVELYGLHASIISSGFDSDRYLGNLLIHMYGCCFNAEGALVAFHKILAPNVFSWNILINAYARNGNISAAELVFKKMPHMNLESWNAMISAFAQLGHANEALQSYAELEEHGWAPDNITFVSAIAACTDIIALVEGMHIHGLIVSYGYASYVSIGTSLINMYGHCGDLDAAKVIFSQMLKHDVIIWNAMIDIYNLNACSAGALDLFHEMHQVGIAPDRPTFLGVIDACADHRSLAYAWVLHSYIASTEHHTDVMVENALITMYGKCGSLEGVYYVFCKMLYHNVITWSSLISAYVAAGRYMEAMSFFYCMELESISPNEFTFSAVLEVCANLRDIGLGHSIHNDLICSGTVVDSVLQVALINFYAKCGSVFDTMAIFDCKFEQDICYWNAKIAVYSLNGYGKQVKQLFAEMQSKGILPDKRTFQLIQ